jgi:hypothetical protein
MIDSSYVSSVSGNTQALYKHLDSSRVSIVSNTDQAQYVGIDKNNQNKLIEITFLLKAANIADKALEMAEAGLDKNDVIKKFNEALKAVSAIKDPQQIECAVECIASNMAKAGLDTNEINIIFKDAGVELPK